MNRLQRFLAFAGLAFAFSSAYAGDFEEDLRRLSPGSLKELFADPRLSVAMLRDAVEKVKPGAQAVGGMAAVRNSKIDSLLIFLGHSSPEIVAEAARLIKAQLSDGTLGRDYLTAEQVKFLAAMASADEKRAAPFAYFAVWGSLGKNRPRPLVHSVRYRFSEGDPEWENPRPEVLRALKDILASPREWPSERERARQALLSLKFPDRETMETVLDAKLDLWLLPEERARYEKKMVDLAVQDQDLQARAWLSRQKAFAPATLFYWESQLASSPAVSNGMAAILARAHPTPSPAAVGMTRGTSLGAVCTALFPWLIR